MDELHLLLRLFLGAVFLLSAVPKIVRPRQFAAEVNRYEILPRSLASLYSLTLPYAALGVAIMLLSGLETRWTSVIAAAMLGSFLIAVAMAMRRGRKLTCKCFGLLYREQVGWSTQVRDGILLAMAVYLALQLGTSWSVIDLFRQADTWRGGTALGLNVAVIGVVFSLSALSIRLEREKRTASGAVS